MNKSFVRGGQLSLHSLRMLKQVCVVLYKFGIALMLILNVAFCFYKLTLYQLKVMYWYGLALIATNLGNQNNLMSVEGFNGRQFEMTASQVMNNSNVLMIKRYVINVLGQGFELSAVISLIIFLLLTVIFLKKGGKFGKDEDIRGSTLVTNKKLKSLIIKYNRTFSYKGYLLGDIPYPAHSENTHTLIAGTTGSGKTILTSSLIAQIKKRGDRAIIYDKMGVYTERFYDPKVDTLLNPFDKRSPNWSIFKEVSQEASFDAIAAALIPLEKNGGDPFWTKAARTIFSEVCGALYRKGGVSNEELVTTLLKKNLAEAALLVKGTAAGALIDESSPKTALSVMSMLATHLKCLKFLKDEGNTFSIREWVQNEVSNGCIFLTSSGDLHSTLTPLISAWIDIAITNILSISRNQNRKIWFILDELPSLHTLPSLGQGLAETRQFGGCFVLSIQSISQLRDSYGSNGAQTISSLCNNKVFLRAGDHESARWYSESIGASEVEEYREGLSYGAHEMRDGVSINRHKHSKYLVLPSELTNLKDKEGFFIMAKGFPVAKVAFEYVEWAKVNERLLESEDKPTTEEPVVPIEHVIKIEEVIKKEEEQSESIKLINCFKA